MKLEGLKYKLDSADAKRFAHEVVAGCKKYNQIMEYLKDKKINESDLSQQANVILHELLEVIKLIVINIKIARETFGRPCNKIINWNSLFGC